MKTFELTTGFIAAVMIALGAAYYVNNSTTVGEESVVATKSNNVHQQCTGNYIWFEVKPGEEIECGDLAAITQITLNLHDVSVYDPLSDMSSWTTSQSGAASLTGCDDFPSFNCAVGYTVDANNFELSADGLYWQPKQNVMPECYICRPTP